MSLLTISRFGTEMNKMYIRFVVNQHGDVAQLVEHRTENPCVGGSSPPITTRPSKTMVATQERY